MSGHTTEHDLGLAHDLATLNRRRALALLGGLAVAACTPSAPGSSAPGSSTADPSTEGSSAPGLKPIPDETAGPFPADGSNGLNVLTESGIVRSDVRSSFGAASGTAQGVPLTITLTVRDTAKGGAPYAGAAVYLWQCDGNGDYSMYSEGVVDQNYLRGVQEADGSGEVTFTSTFPAAYDGRWPHVHFEVYPSLAEATSAGEPVKTTQLAFPKDVCETVYATDGYGASVRNLASTSLESDMVFRDGHDTQLATVTGDVTSGYTATLVVEL